MSDSPDSAEGGVAFQDVSYGSYATGGGDESRESFETSGHSSSHNEQLVGIIIRVHGNFRQFCHLP